jgi:hypothetical protein
MPWYRIILDEPASEELHLTEKFLDVILDHESGSPSSALWRQKQDSTKNQSLYFLRTEHDGFRAFLDEFGAEECKDPDMSLLLPVAGAAKQA